MHIIDFKTQNILNLILLIPEKFKDVLILDSYEIENFDIGYESFYLAIDTSIPFSGHELFDSPEDAVKKLRCKYHVFTDRSRIPEDYTVEFFKRQLISKPINMLGDLVEDENEYYNWKVRKILGWSEKQYQDNLNSFIQPSYWSWEDV